MRKTKKKNKRIMGQLKSMHNEKCTSCWQAINGELKWNLCY